MGYWPQEVIERWKSKSDWIWFHAVSVGEFNAVWPLVLDIKNKKPGSPIMVSCTTRAGHKLALEKAKDKDILVFLFPLDFPHVVKKLFKLAKVKALVITETEIWPTVLSEAYRNKIPTILVNARISDRSYKNYMFLRFYFKNVVNLFTKVLAQSESDLKKFISLGVDENKVQNLGNIKFAATTNELEKYKNESEVKVCTNGSKNLIFASTHKGEEKLAIDVYKELSKDHPELNLIIAPRHIERIEEINNLTISNSLTPKYKSKNEMIEGEGDIFILDTIGELIKYLKISDITVLGGSFAEIGGHNILEPICSNSYTLIGPHDFKITEMSNVFKKRDALVQVKDKNELIQKIKEALRNNELRKITIENGISIIKENEGGLKQTSQQILSFLWKI